MKRKASRKPARPAASTTPTPKTPPPDFGALIKAAEKSGEQDFRLMMLEALTQTPHRQVEPFIPLFRLIHDRDPLFFGKLAVWYSTNGTVRDLKQLFVAFLSTSSFSEDYREAGVAMLHSLPPFEVERVLGIIKGHKNDDGKFVTGVSPSVPRIVRTEIERYLRQREKNSEQFDSVAMVARGALKKLYGSLRIKPSDYAQKLLFDNDPPETSRLYSLKLLAKETDPTNQARLIIEYKIPYRVAISSLTKMTGPVLVALVNAMTPQEVINNMASLQKKGAMDNADIKSLIDKKIKAAETDKRVSALKTREAVKASNLDAETVQALEQVQDKQIKARGRIKKSTALLIDKSGSMTPAIKLGKEMASMIAPICEKELYVYAFDSMAYPITPEGNGMSDWEKAFKGILATGYTACGAGFDALRKRSQRVEQIIMVTDQQENKAPFFMSSFEEYRKALATDPNVIFINIAGQEGITDKLHKQLDIARVTVDSWTFTGDYYGLPSILPMLSGGSRIDFLNEIMELELPKRKPVKEPVGASV